MFIVFISLILQLTVTLRPCARKVALKPFTWHWLHGKKQATLGSVLKRCIYIYTFKKNIRMCESWKLIRDLFYLGKFSPPNYLGHDEEIRVCVSASLKSVERVVDPPKSVPYLRSGPAVLFVIKLSALSHFYYPKFPSNSINELICSSFRKKKWSCRLLMNVHHDQQSPVKFWGWGVTSATWMSPEVSKWLVNGL